MQITEFELLSHHRKLPNLGLHRMRDTKRLFGGPVLTRITHHPQPSSSPSLFTARENNMEHEVDGWIAQLSQCKQLSEADVKRLCDKVCKLCLMYDKARRHRGSVYTSSRCLLSIYLGIDGFSF